MIYKNRDQVIDIPMRDSSGKMVIDPTFEAGDVQISLDGGAYANMATDPTVTAGTPFFAVTISAAESNGSRVSIQWIDQNGDQWTEGYLYGQTVIDVSTDIGNIPKVGSGPVVRTLTANPTANSITEEITSV